MHFYNILSITPFFLETYQWKIKWHVYANLMHTIEKLWVLYFDNTI